MIQPLNVELAQRIGIRSALVAQCLWDLLKARHPAQTDIFDGRQWLRMGQKSLTTVMPYLTRDTARFELGRLQRIGIVRARPLSDNPFDHTLWFSFTDYGTELMVATESIDSVE